MKIDRRDLMKGASALGVAAILPKPKRAKAWGKAPGTVMAWYMPAYCAFSTSPGSTPTVLNYLAEFQQMQAVGIDVALCDMFSWNTGYAPLNFQAAAANMFAAVAMMTGFRLAFSVDWGAAAGVNSGSLGGAYTIVSLGSGTNWAGIGAGSSPYVGQNFTLTATNGGGSGTIIEAASNAGAMMAAYGNNPNYFYYQGKPFVSAYDGAVNTNSVASAFWPACIASINAAGFSPFFCPVFLLSGFSAGTLTTDGAFVTNTQYTIVSLGTTNWSAIGATGTPYVGQQFTATGPGGSGGGTAISASTTNSGMLSNFNNGWINAPVNGQTFLQGLMNWPALIPTLNLQRNSGFNYVASQENILAVPCATSWFGILRFLYLDNPTTYYEGQGFVGMAQTWQAAIGQKSPLVMIGTWNDYTESYCSPITQTQFNNACWTSKWQVSPTFWNDHSGFTEMMRYWINQFKRSFQGSSTVYPAKEVLFVTYRQGAQTLAQAASYTRAATALVNGQKVTVTFVGTTDFTLVGGTNTVGATFTVSNASAGAGTGTVTPFITWAGDGSVYPAFDNWFVTTFCQLPSTLTVNSGGNITTISVAAGLVHSTGAFTAGSQSFTLTRGGNIIANMPSTTAPTIPSSLSDQTNMNPWTGSAYASYP